MSDNVIKVEHVTKKYHLGTIGHGTLYRDVQSWWARVRDKEDPNAKISLPDICESRDFLLALDDVSFDVKRGDVVGIIGRNGAGKSTLLKIISRVTAPTKGEVKINGRVASLLEVGTGFHPELTGRENVYLSGAILGMKKKEINRKFDEIVDFSGVERFIDTPVKRYSSGMYVRLAFAVAAHLEPEILIVDEVLSVGDVQFQKKCVGKMEDVSAEEGRTVLFVSHNLEMVRQLCGISILLEQGKLAAMGVTYSVLEKYLKSSPVLQSSFPVALPQDAFAPGYAERIVVEDINGNETYELAVGQSWQIRVHFTILHQVEHFIIALGFKTDMNVPLRTTYTIPQDIKPGKYQAIFRERETIHANGLYQITIGLSSYERSFHYVENAAMLRVSEFSEGKTFVRLQGVGMILNQMESEIISCDKEE
jgi:lipopolysaccharide transport system ATP-binding protein